MYRHHITAPPHRSSLPLSALHPVSLPSVSTMYSLTGTPSPQYHNGATTRNETELGSKTLQIQSKRFYIDMKQNGRGRFIKVAEIAADGRRAQVYLALSTAAEFRDHLTAFSVFYSRLGPANSGGGGGGNDHSQQQHPSSTPATAGADNGKLKSEVMVKDSRRYFLDLKENSRGRFLRVSQTVMRGGLRTQVAIPAQGLIEFRDALTDLLDEFGADDPVPHVPLPPGRHMRAENKNFYFDVGQNERGVYMRISEVKANFRSSVTIPERAWARFRDIFAEYVDRMAAAVDSGSSAPSGDTAPSSEEDQQQLVCTSSPSCSPGQQKAVESVAGGDAPLDDNQSTSAV